MFELNATYFIFIASFLVFIALLNEIMLKPVERVLKQRATKIRNDIDDGRSAREHAEQVLEAYHLQLQKTKGEAQALVNEALESANSYRTVELNRLKVVGQEKLQFAQAKMSSETDSLIEELVKEETTLVRDITAKLLGEPVAVHLDADTVRHTLKNAL